MRVTMLLCDAAQVADGKLFVLGGGWSITGATMGPSAIALKLEVPWDQTNVAHHWELYLVDADGRPVTIQTDDGQQAIEVRGDFEVGRPLRVATHDRRRARRRMDRRLLDPVGDRAGLMPRYGPAPGDEAPPPPPDDS